MTQYLPRSAWPALYLPLMLALLRLAWPPLWQAPQCRVQTGRVRMPVPQVGVFDMPNFSMFKLHHATFPAAFVREL